MYKKRLLLTALSFMLVACFFAAFSAPTHAATHGTTTHQAQSQNDKVIHPNVSGVDCTTQIRIAACISENSSQTILPDGYVRYAPGCIKVVIRLYINGALDPDYYQYQPCVYHFYGPSEPGYSGSQYFDSVTAYYNDGTFHANSPTLTA